MKGVNICMARRYIYDTKTTNISFIQTALDLKRLGIRDHMFFLKLYDTSLQGIDPHDPMLPEEYIIRIINECVINPWYFLREVARIEDQGNPKGISYSLNRANLAATWCFLNGIDFYLVIPRQIGKTQSVISILDWAFLLGTTNSEFLFLNMEAPKSIENLNRLKTQRDLLPKYLQFKVHIDDEGKEVKAIDNVKTLANESTKNKIVTKGQARSVTDAERIGRGSTMPIQFIDEFEFIPKIGTIMAAAGPAFSTASANAERNKGMYGRCITSTPGDLDSESGIEALAILDNTYKWTEKFYDMDIEDVKNTILMNSKNRIVYIEYSYKQLGKDEDWFNRMCSFLNGDKLKIKRELLLQRLRGSNLSPYDAEDLQAITDKKGTIIEELFIIKYFKLDIYSKLDKNKIYFIGVDVANGYNEDSSAITIFDPYEFKSVAEFRSPYIGVKDLINLLYVLVRQYIPRSILAIERNANGEAVLEHLRDSSVRANIYYDNSKDLVQDLDDKVDSKGFLEKQAEKRKLYGIYTGTKSRQRMFELLGGLIKENKDVFVCENIIDDIMKLVRKNNKIQAANGAHDDSIMSFLMCIYLYYYGNNLSRYGFVRGSLPSEDEMNKGMDYGYDQLVDMLSETDKQFFESAPKMESTGNDFNIAALIEEKRGLISEDEMISSMRTMKRTVNSGAPKLDPYQQKIYREMLQAERESAVRLRGANFINSYENMDNEFEDNEVFVDFTDLNS